MVITSSSAVDAVMRCASRASAVAACASSEGGWPCCARRRSQAQEGAQARHREHQRGAQQGEAMQDAAAAIGMARVHDADQ